MIDFYAFMELPDYKDWEAKLSSLMGELSDVRGTIIVASEGINASLCGPDWQLSEVINLLKQDSRFAEINIKFSKVDRQVFKSIKIKRKKEIVSFKRDGVSHQEEGAVDLDAEEWNALISLPDIVLIDARNEFEYDMGSFADAINPKVQKFSELAEYVKSQKDEIKDKQVAIFCTGGIRCEKLGRYMKQVGIKKVYQLKDGILGYLAKISEDENLWQGDCFVFDERISVSRDDFVKDRSLSKY